MRKSQAKRDAQRRHPTMLEIRYRWNPRSKDGRYPKDIRSHLKIISRELGMFTGGTSRVTLVHRKGKLKGIDIFAQGPDTPQNVLVLIWLLAYTTGVLTTLMRHTVRPIAPRKVSRAFARAMIAYVHDSTLPAPSRTGH